MSVVATTCSAVCTRFASAWDMPRRSSPSAYAMTASGISATNARVMHSGW